MKKLANPREWLGTGIQLMIFAALLPTLSVILGLLMEGSTTAKENFASSVLSYLPFYDNIQLAITGTDISKSGYSALRYIVAVMDTIGGNMIGAMYLGSWLYAFRLIFKESILAGYLRLRGLPILQHVCGLFLGAITFSMLDDNIALTVMVTLFVLTLDIVLTIVLVDKARWKKVLDLVINLSLQSYLAGLTIGYVVALVICFKGLYSNVTQAITAIVTTTLLWLVYLITQYFITEK